MGAHEGTLPREVPIKGQGLMFRRWVADGEGNTDPLCITGVSL